MGPVSHRLGGGAVEVALAFRKDPSLRARDRRVELDLFTTKRAPTPNDTLLKSYIYSLCRSRNLSNASIFGT